MISGTGPPKARGQLCKAAVGLSRLLTEVLMALTGLEDVALTGRCQQGARLWAFMCGVTLDFSRPGKPTDNAFIESLKGKFRVECLNTNWSSASPKHGKNARLGVGTTMRSVRISIGNQVPAVLHRSAGNPGQSADR
jgi:Integrase core domain